MKSDKQLYGRSYWVEETEWIDSVIKRLQVTLDSSDVDVRLRYEQRYSLYDKFHAILLEFSDGIMRTSAEEINEVADQLNKQLTHKVINQAFNKLYWFSESTRNVMAEVSISYVLVERCETKPGVVIFWKK